MTRTYLELSQLQTFEERFEYLKLSGLVGAATFGGSRHLNQTLYRSREWKDFRNKIIIRDNGCDLGVEGYEVNDRILIHHINPITPEDILNRDPCIFDPNNVICVSHNTHEAIHYSDESILISSPVIRTPNDTCLWRK